MDSSEKLSYAMGFLDCWQMFKKQQNDPDTVLKKTYIFENLLPLLAPSWTDSQVNELIIESREENIIKKIHQVIQSKFDRDHMLKEIDKHKIDWSNL